MHRGDCNLDLNIFSIQILSGIAAFYAFKESYESFLIIPIKFKINCSSSSLSMVVSSQ